MSSTPMRCPLAAASTRLRRARLVASRRVSSTTGMERLRDLWRHRALGGVLVAREVKARYRGSVLGFFWSLLNPLLMLAVYAVVFQLLLPNRSPSTSP